ncbi:MAG TPA: hypothetical protein VGD19_08405 [Allosphingosinicella sp.]|jgi:hypothetical protein
MVNGTGKHKERGVGGKPDLAFVVDKSISFQIGEMMYRNRGYSPPFDQLPWGPNGQG